MKSLTVVITNFGDLALLLPLAAILALALWRFESRAAAWAWTQALALCIVVTVLLKLSFLTCGRAWGVNIASPSGHASMSTLVYGGFAAVMSVQTARGRPLIIASAVLWIAAIAVSRTVLRFHSTVEVEIGLAVGLAALSVFVWKYRPLAHRKMNLTVIGVGTLCVLALLYGVRSPAEALLYRFAHTVRAQTRICQDISAPARSTAWTRETVPSRQTP
jgi:membrane-associated phospholipid phosphatase